MKRDKWRKRPRKDKKLFKIFISVWNVQTLIVVVVQTLIVVVVIEMEYADGGNLAEMLSKRTSR